jgi:hypothetical protein
MRRLDTLKSAVALAMAGAALVASRRAEASGGRLLVYLHLVMKQRALQTAFEAALPGVTVTAVGRVADLERGLSDGQDAVLALSGVLSQRNWPLQLRGLRRGATEETYSLVGTDSPPDPQRVDSVGALDLFGRDGTERFVKGLLGAAPKVQRVTKVEDLLPLLQIQRVAGVILPSRLITELQSGSRLKLAGRELPQKVGLPAATALNAGGAAILAGLRRLPPSLSLALGVDEWR